MQINRIYNGDCLELAKTLPDNFINCCITSPPYFQLRRYTDSDLEIGLEETPEQYIEKLVVLFRELRRALRPDGTLWVNIGDSYNVSGNGIGSNKGNPHSIETGNATKIKGLKPKDLIGVPWMLAFALRADGWWLRQEIIWSKGNPMPASVKDRCTTSHEQIFLLSKSRNYYFDYEAIREPCSEANIKDFKGRKTMNNLGGGVFANVRPDLSKRGRDDYMSEDFKRNKRSVWEVNLKPSKDGHIAAFPQKLIVPMIEAGCPKGGIVLDPFIGSGTVASVASRLERKYIGFELNAEYCKIIEKKLNREVGLWR